MTGTAKIRVWLERKTIYVAYVMLLLVAQVLRSNTTFFDRNIEDIPANGVEPNSVDVVSNHSKGVLSILLVLPQVISNCVINLVQDKGKVLCQVWDNSARW